MENTDKLLITPKTKVLQLIESYPELEDILIEYAPAFKKLKNPEKIFLTLIDFISKMYKKVDLVHSDMSPFNVLIYKDQPYIIDIGQGVLTEHHNAHDFLKRDIHNIVRFFRKYDIESDEKKIYNDITKK